MQAQPVRHLILALAVAMAPLVFELPWWTIVWCLSFWGYRLVKDHTRSPMPSPAVRILFFSIGLGLLLQSAGLRFDGGDFIALLAVMAGVKPMEVRGRRDSMVTVFLAYFLVITSLFVFENLSMTVYLFVSVWITTAVLAHVNHPEGAFVPQMKLSARLVLSALPLLLLLFLVFPRLSGNFWGVPWARQSRSGFSSVIRMGDVSRLVVTDTPVFSVSFDASVPDPDQRYWRGIVFQTFDGDTWKPSRRQPIRRAPVQGDHRIRYRVVLEPHGHRNLFALDLPQRAPPLAVIMDDHTVMGRRPVRQRLTYMVTSVLDFRQSRPVHPGAPCLQLPPNRNPRTRALGRQLALNHAHPSAVVNAGLEFFKTSGFSYTLHPDPLGRDAVDDFLFVSRKGFCEHFASAFTILMRSAGIPARMVGGYQGGWWNEWGNFLTVRQADAHVWCEVWLDPQGWIRVDPTVEVAPDRINDGIDGLFEELPWLSRGHRIQLLSQWIEKVRQAWAAVNIRWNIWFMGFSAEEQDALLKTVWYHGQWLLLAMVPLAVTVAVFLGYRWQRRRQPKTIQEKALTVYNRFLKKMSRAGLAKPPYQGALDHYRTVIRHHPRIETPVREIVDRYLMLRYGREPDDDNLKVLSRRVRRFYPRRLVKMDNEE